MTLFPKCYNRPIPPPFPFCGPWAPREAKCPAEHGHLRMQTPDPGICPTLAQPHSRPRRGPGARQQRLRWGAGWPLAPLPPQAPRPGSFHPAAQLPAHPPGPRHQSTPGPLLPLSFLPSSSLPNLSLFFFSSPLALLSPFLFFLRSFLLPFLFLSFFFSFYFFFPRGTFRVSPYDWLMLNIRKQEVN